MKSLYKDESALSYSIVTIFVVLIYMSVLWMGVAEVVNDLSAQHDQFVDAGEVTEQTQKFYNMSVNLFKSNIMFGVIGLVLWGIRQSKYDTSSTTKSMSLLVGSATIMVVLSFVSVLMVFSFAHPLDMALMGIIESGVMDVAGITETNNLLIVDIFYLACIAPAIIGIAIHLLTSVEKIGYGVFEDSTTTSTDYYVPEEY